MAFLDNLVGGRGIRQQRRIADEFVKKMYDADMLNPMAEQSRETAMKGIADEQIRRQLVEQIYRTDSDVIELTGGNQGRALAAQLQMDMGMADALSDAELELFLQDELAKQLGRKEFAQISSQQQQIRSQREAKLEENKLAAEAELQNRKRSLLANIISTGIGIGFMPTKSVGDTAGFSDTVFGSLFSGLFGGRTSNGLDNIMDTEKETGFPSAYNFEAGTSPYIDLG